MAFSVKNVAQIEEYVGKSSMLANCQKIAQSGKPARQTYLMHPIKYLRQQ
jgi:hypothetical protein